MSMNEKKIKVCHITSAHSSNDGRIFQKECRTLAKEGRFEVYLIAQGKSRKEDGVKVIGIGAPPKGRLQRIINTSNKVYRKALNLNADIYHLHDPELLLYALKLKKTGSIVIFDSHEIYCEQIAQKKYLPVFLRKLVLILYKIFENYVVKRIDAVVFTTTVNGKNPFKKKCKVTTIIGNYPILDERRHYIEHKGPQGEGIVNVCYTGSLSEERGITNLVKACYMTGAKLILAGNFSSEEYMKEIMNMKEAACIDYRGFCDYDSITKLYQESDIGAATLLKIGQYATGENLATKVYEYMQVGLPVILTDTEYIVQLMKKENFAYLVNSNDITAISDMINYISENYSETVKKTKLAHELVIKKYNWNAEGEKLIKLYLFLLKNKKM